MKNILNKVYLHPLFLICVLAFTLMGYFRFISYFMLLILVHESGHILIAMVFKWNIDKIIILPFGGLTKFNEIINVLGEVYIEVIIEHLLLVWHF